MHAWQFSFKIGSGNETLNEIIVTDFFSYGEAEERFLDKGKSPLLYEIKYLGQATNVFIDRMKHERRLDKKISYMELLEFKKEILSKGYMTGDIIDTVSAIIDEVLEYRRQVEKIPVINKGD